MTPPSPGSTATRCLAGALGVVACVLVVIQVYRAHLSVADLDAGAWMALSGGIVTLVGGFFGTRRAVIAAAPAGAPTLVEEP